MGVLRAELGEVQVVKTFGMKGFDDTRRVMLACRLSVAAEVMERLEVCTGRPRRGTASSSTATWSRWSSRR